MRLYRLSWLAIAAVAMTLAASGFDAVAAGDQESQLGTVEQQLQSSKAEQERIAAEIAAALQEQEDISAKLVDISQRIQSQEASISGSEARLLKMNQEEVVILSDLAEKQDVLSELLAGLQRLEQNPPPALVVEPNDVLAALRGAMMFGAIVPELRDEARALSQKLARLEDLRAGVRQRKAALSADIERLQASRDDLKTLVDRKRQLVAAANTELDGERQRTADLAGKAQTLKQLIASLAEDQKRQEVEKAKQAAAEALNAKRQQDAREQPKIALADAKGRLAYPAQGQILKRFGDDDGLGGTLHGLVIATRETAQVTAPADGRVEFSGPFRSYGQVLILNAGGGYHVLLAGMDRISAQTGEFLRAGEPVGQMGNGPSSVTLLGDVIQDKRPVLYIEFRNNIEAIDSSPWWIGGRQEARG